MMKLVIPLPSQSNSACFDLCLPFFDLSGKELCQVLWRAAFRRNYVAPDLLESMLNGRHVERSHGSPIELLNDRGRRRGGCKERIPTWDIETGQPLLVCGRKFRQNR